MFNSIKITALSLLLLVTSQSQAAKILFAHVGAGYYSDGQNLAGALSAAGHNVTSVRLDLAQYSNWSTYDQIFVYDLNIGADTNPNQMFNYMGIANWYNNLSSKNLILDGRIISSSTSWTNRPNGGPSEHQWIQNYATQLNLRNGGLVLGTDHAPNFTPGINEINRRIGVSDFFGYFYQAPYEAQVDTNSPLFVSSLGRCVSDSTKYCINDNSSTSFVATGLQANGQTLTPVAYHGTTSEAFNVAAVSTTMGSITFGTCGGVGQQPCSVSASSSGIALIGSLGLLLISIRKRFW